VANIRLSRDAARSSKLPMMCIRCGERPAALIPMSLPYVPTKAGINVPKESVHAMFHGPGALLVLAFGGASILHGLRHGRRVELWMPLCERHTRTAWWHSFGLPVASVIAAILACLLAILDACAWWQGFQEHWAFGLAALTCFFLALLIRAHNHDGFLYPLEVTESDVELSGASEEFVFQCTHPERE
jgi:hypothetical protein